MNQVMPPWRTFPATAASQAAAPHAPAAGDGPAGGEGPAGSPAGPADAGGRRHLGWLAPLLAGIGGVAAGTSVALVMVLLLGSLPAAGGDPLSAFGEPLMLDVSADLAPVSAGAADDEIVVDIGGAVARPGLHRLRAGDRVGDAIEVAGGYSARVDLLAAGLSLNLAQPLEDGAKIVVPELGVDAIEPPDPGDGRIDLNSADQAALESLPGIGPVTAGKIIAARTERRFSSPRELRTRGIVGESVYADLESLVRAG